MEIYRRYKFKRALNRNPVKVLSKLTVGEAVLYRDLISAKFDEMNQFSARFTDVDWSERNNGRA